LIYRLTNEFERSLGYIEKNLQTAPQWSAQYTLQIEVLCSLKRFDEAWQVIVSQENDPMSPLSIDELKGIYYAYHGEQEKAYSYADKLLKEAENDPISNAPHFAYLCQIYLVIGDDGKALYCLEQGARFRSVPILFITIESQWDRLRGHPRYKAATNFLNAETLKTRPEPTFKKYKKTPLPGSLAKKLKTALNDTMLKDKPYLDPKLNLSDLAEMIHCSPNQLSQLLNENMGKNFYDYVNDYRLHYFQSLNRDPKNRQFTFLSLAYESGFNSKTTFNNFFKKTLGVTPSEYLK
jgi:AraC-like DNA-binding protein